MVQSIHCQIHLRQYLNPGDEVIVPVPYWVSYTEIIKLNDGVPVLVSTKKENNFKMTKEELARAITTKTKAILINTPNNPTGSIYSEQELRDIAEIAVENNLFVVSDEIYERLTYDGKKHVSIASLGDDIKELTIVINGMSKAYAMTGWRLGYAAGNEKTYKSNVKCTKPCCFSSKLNNTTCISNSVKWTTG